VGQRLLGGVSKMMMDRFFNCLKARLEHQESGT
jgi:carbon monoxide dehydrogenase subunit G